MNDNVAKLLDAIAQVVLGKEQQSKLALACVLARGHLLIEDLPGMGKTTLAQCLSKVLGLSYERVQFTSDLLPADILGVSVFDRTSSNFRFHPGPVFTQVLLADEINRATPKAQSALLEAMEERQVTVEGETRALPDPFFVIATQNPLSQTGTYPLPESQLDRFLMCISLGYPSHSAERALFEGTDPRQRLAQLRKQIDYDQLTVLQARVGKISASPQLLDYLQRLVAFTRSDPAFVQGLSPRGALAWLNASRAWALIHDRQHLLPEDLQAVMQQVVSHRVVVSSSARDKFPTAASMVDYLKGSVDVIGGRGVR